MATDAAPAPAPDERPAAEAPRPPVANPFEADWWKPFRVITPELMSAWRKARTAIAGVDRSGENTEKGYGYSTMGDYASAVEGGLEHHGLSVIVETVTPLWRSVTARNGGSHRECVVIIRGHVYHEAGGSLPFQFPGEARDGWDKSLYKTITGARKYALSCLFNLKGGTDVEADDVPHEEAPSAADNPENARNRPQQRQTAERQNARAAEPRPAAAAAAPAADPAPPPEKKKNALERIAEAPNSAVLISELDELLRKMPPAHFADKWAKIITATEERIKPWSEKHQAAVMALVYSARSAMAGAVAASSEAAAPAGGPPDATAQAAAQALTLEELCRQVEDQKTPDELSFWLQELVLAAANQPVRDDADLFAKTVDHALWAMEARLHSGEWSEADTELLLTSISEAKKATGTAIQMKEATGG